MKGTYVLLRRSLSVFRTGCHFEFVRAATYALDIYFALDSPLCWLPRWLSGKRIHLPMQETPVWSLVWEGPWSRKWQPTPVFLSGKSMERRALWATVHGVAKSWTWLSVHMHRRTHSHLFYSWTHPVSQVTLHQFCVQFKIKCLLSYTNKYKEIQYFSCVPPTVTPN